MLLWVIATLTLTEGQLSITADVTLLIDGDSDGDGEIDITIDGNDSSRIFNITAGDITLDHLRLTGGNSDVGNNGGAIDVDGADLTVSNSEIVDNQAQNYGGGIYFSGDGNLDITDSLIAFNQVWACRWWFICCLMVASRLPASVTIYFAGSGNLNVVGRYY